MKLILGAVKNVVLITCLAFLFYGLHRFLLVQFFKGDGIDDLLTKQHILLFSLSIFVYVTIYISHFFLPEKAGFVFLGLIMAKMIISGFFLHSIGWLEEGVPMYKKALFLLFYMLYSLILVYFCVLKFKGESNDLESNN